MNNSDPPLRIDIVSDVVCPWCIIGYRQLVEALKITNTTYKIYWHSFELNPDMPLEGQNLRDHIVEKYGSSIKDIEENRRQMTQLGADVGFEFHFSDELHTYNTFNMHQLLHWADQQGRMHELKLALFAAHFTHQRNLSDNEVLAEIAAEVGLERAEALGVLESQRFATEVRNEQRISREQNIQGVPAMIFNRRHLVTGAQGVENYTHILEQLAEMQD